MRARSHRYRVPVPEWHIPLTPEPESVMKARFEWAMERTYPMEQTLRVVTEILKGNHDACQELPQFHQENVFDWQDGLRLVVVHETLAEFQHDVLSVFAMVGDGTEMHRKIVEAGNVPSVFEGYADDCRRRFGSISGMPGEALEFHGWVKNDPRHAHGFSAVPQPCFKMPLGEPTREARTDA